MFFFFFQSVFSVWFDIEKQNKLEYYKKKPVSKISEEHLLTATCMQSEVWTAGGYFLYQTNLSLEG